MSKNTHRKTNLDQFDPRAVIQPDDYEPFIGRQRVDILKKLAEPLAGKEWTNINSTLMGGGVAEILRSMVPLARGLGLKAHWYSIRGNHIFFQTTKKFHNMLQGLDLPISMEEIFGAYLNTLEENARNISIASDLIVLHDPQPAGLINHGVLFGSILWRCHIDTSKPHNTVWRFLLPYINQFSGAIFTMPEFVGPGIQIPQYEVSPSIDPLAPKNKQVSREEALKILKPLFDKYNIDADRPIIAAISRYDIHKNQESSLIAFNKLRQEKKWNPPPYLIFLGNTANDDPEGDTVLEMLQNKAGEDPDIKFWVNVKNNDKVVGALMALARGFNHVSTKEGFGLVVAEALWQGTPVIGSKVGGIKKQIIDKENGFLVDPLDVNTIAEKMAWLLENEDQANQMGKNGQEHIRQNFLLPTLISKYLKLMKYHTIDRKAVPDFRLNGPSHSEFIDTIYHKGLEAASNAMSKPKSNGGRDDVKFKIL